ncbi:MAG: hypothetical protein BWX70_03034 [Verrucomicrobia bacterium ADurb.Bin070]|nr:MAG: hypothetical protein BWX70_03034 [Verrucomicrobia bacterium ADurb.Bin070]
MGQFRAHLLQKRAVRGIQRARKHEVVPDHQAQLVAKLVKGVILELAAAPQTDHVHVRVARRRQQVAVALRCLTLRQTVTGDPVRPLAEEILPVYSERHTHAGTCRRVAGIRLVDHLDCPQPQPPREGVRADRHREVIEMLSARAARPPQLRPLDHHRRREAIHARLQRHRSSHACLAERDRQGAVAAFGRHHLCRDRHFADAGTMGLIAIDIIDARQIAAQQLHGTREPGSHQRDAPVPSAVAGGLADQVDVRHPSVVHHRDWIAERVAALLRDLLRAVKQRGDRVASRPQQ